MVHLDASVKRRWDCPSRVPATLLRTAAGHTAETLVET